MNETAIRADNRRRESVWVSTEIFPESFGDGFVQKSTETPGDNERHEFVWRLRDFYTNRCRRLPGRISAEFHTNTAPELRRKIPVEIRRNERAKPSRRIPVENLTTTQENASSPNPTNSRRT